MMDKLTYEELEAENKKLRMEIVKLCDMAIAMCDEFEAESIMNSEEE